MYKWKEIKSKEIELNVERGILTTLQIWLVLVKWRKNKDIAKYVHKLPDS